MRNKYSLNFSAYDGTFFTLTFTIAGGRFIHLVEDVEVYQHSFDLMCEVISIGTHPSAEFKARISAQTSPYTFAISIQPTPTGASVYVAETSVTITCIQHPNLQPCN